MKAETISKIVKGALIAAGTGVGLLLSKCIAVEEETESGEVVPDVIDGTCEVVEETGGEEG